MVGRFFDASVIFEADIEVNGWSFLTIYGMHANGYFIAIPNWGISCEASRAEDVFYNAEKLRGTKPNVGEKLTAATARILAQEINNMVAHLRVKEGGESV